MLEKRELYFYLTRAVVLCVHMSVRSIYIYIKTYVLYFSVLLSRTRSSKADLTLVTHRCIEVGLIITATKAYLFNHVLLLRVHMSVGSIATYLYF